MQNIPSDKDNNQQTNDNLPANEDLPTNDELDEIDKFLATLPELDDLDDGLEDIPRPELIREPLTPRVCSLISWAAFAVALVIAAFSMPQAGTIFDTAFGTLPRAGWDFNILIISILVFALSLAASLIGLIFCLVKKTKFNTAVPIALCVSGVLSVSLAIIFYVMARQ